MSERGDAPRPRPPLFVRLWVPRSATAVATVAPVTVTSGDTMPNAVLSAFSLSIDSQNRLELGGRSPAFACAEEARETRACGSPTRESRTECSVRRVPCVRARAFVCASSPEGPKGTCKNHKAEGAEKAVTRQKSEDFGRFLGSFLGSRGRVLSAIISAHRRSQSGDRSGFTFVKGRRRLALRLGFEFSRNYLPLRAEHRNSLHVCHRSDLIDHLSFLSQSRAKQEATRPRRRRSKVGFFLA